ncbi:MAG: ABC transporter permease [Alphaproteobacteria bacterium]|nr:ABC transporter permease [Alphaproteobacteria bacterium]
MNEFGWFFVRRVLQGAVVVLGVTALVFVFTRLIGDPVAIMLPLEATEAERAQLRAYLGLDRSLGLQFLEFLRQLTVLEFGDSFWQRRPNVEIIVERLPWTLLLVGASMTLAVVLALPLGTIAALYPGRLPDRLTSFLSLAGLSIPLFWLGLMLIFLFAAKLQWLPSSGPGGLAHLVLPSVTLALPAAGRIAMLLRSTLIDELNAPYVRTAIAKGLPARRVITVHTFINAAVPVLTMIGWEVTRALAGYTIVVETVFAWPGLGLVAVQAIQRDDLVLVQAIVFVVAILVVAVNLLLDVAHRLIDPRVKL